MGERTGLYEYLAVDAPPGPGPHTQVTGVQHREEYDMDPCTGVVVDQNIGTVLTHADAETFDDDNGLGSLSYLDDTTFITRTEGETYDDDSGLGSLGMPSFGTDKTGAGGDDYDVDQGLLLFEPAGREAGTGGWSASTGQAAGSETAADQ